MRNLFDQYSQPENKLTHALLVSLDADPKLLRRFLSWAGRVPPPTGRLQIFEQSLPGSLKELTEQDAEKRGLPDGCVTNGKDWTLLLESKFAAKLTLDQIRRHLRTAQEHGLIGAKLLAITTRRDHKNLPPNVVHRSWPEIYAWLTRQGKRSEWARRCAEYLEVAEEKESSEEYLKEGMLTTFTGIPFGPDTPYSYVTAKRTLGLLREELCRDRRLRSLGADLNSVGRSAITGRDGSVVWDFIPLRHARSASVFTQYPHLTMGVRDAYVEAYVTIPNGIRSRLRSNLLGESSESFRTLLLDVLAKFQRIVRTTNGVPTCVLVQRHYATQRSKGIEDCLLRFDMRTALPRGSAGAGKVKPQPEWIDACYTTLKRRRSNLQFQVGVSFPYASCKVVDSPRIAKVFADVYLACRPIIKATLD